MSKGKNKFYVVWVGQNPGIYNSWSETQLQIKGFPKAKYKSFKSLEAAKKAFGEAATDHIGNKKSKSIQVDWHAFKSEIELDSISVDAACSKNPGIMEYRAVVTETGHELFRMGPFEEGTNNIGEFLALVQAIASLKKANEEGITIYTDSRTALSWLRNKRVKTTLKSSEKNKELFALLDRAILWLKNNEVKNPIKKWNTERWGEIPADFGRK